MTITPYLQGIFKNLYQQLKQKWNHTWPCSFLGVEMWDFCFSTVHSGKTNSFCRMPLLPGLWHVNNSYLLRIYHFFLRRSMCAFQLSDVMFKTALTLFLELGHLLWIAIKAIHSEHWLIFVREVWTVQPLRACLLTGLIRVGDGWQRFLVHWTTF